MLIAQFAEYSAKVTLISKIANGDSFALHYYHKLPFFSDTSSNIKCHFTNEISHWWILCFRNKQNQLTSLSQQWSTLHLVTKNIFNTDGNYQNKTNISKHFEPKTSNWGSHECGSGPSRNPTKTKSTPF